MRKYSSADIQLLTFSIFLLLVTLMLMIYTFYKPSYTTSSKIGPTGYQGPPNGPTGYTGPTGIPGFTGPLGSPGIQGSPGNNAWQYKIKNMVYTSKLSISNFNGYLINLNISNNTAITNEIYLEYDQSFFPGNTFIIQISSPIGTQSYTVKGTKDDKTSYDVINGTLSSGANLFIMTGDNVTIVMIKI